MRRQIIKTLQKIFWIYIRANFFVTTDDEFKVLTFPVDWQFVPITTANCSRVREFRRSGLMTEYQDKVAHGEKGFFAVIDGTMAGSIWATTSIQEAPMIAKTYIRLNPKEALIHDIVTGEKYRGRGIGTFMLQEMIRVLIGEEKMKKIFVDVNVKNKASLRMMDKLGLKCSGQMLYISAFSRLILEKSFGQS